MASVLAELVDEHIDELRNAQFTYTDDDEDEPQSKRRRRKTNGATTEDTEDEPKIRPGD